MNEKHGAAFVVCVLFRFRRHLAPAFAIAAAFFLVAHHFLSPPDCAFYWAWAETLARQGNFSFSEVYERLQMPTLYVWLTPTGRLSNDWPLGSGLLLLPVVLAGRAVAHAWIVLWVVAALAVWARSAPFSAAGRLWALAAVVFGTPLFFYAAFGPFFSHPASFAAVAFFVAAWERTRGSRSRREWLLLGLLLGFATLVRPQNALIAAVLIPEGVSRFRQRRLPGFSDLALFAGGAAVAFAPQMIAWWTIYGSPLAVPKLDEMHWFAPNLGPLLFSDFHGVLPWTPLYALACLGLLLLFQRDPVLATGLGLLLGLQVYVNAANLVWWSGGSFGNRRLADVAIVAAYGVGALWDGVRPRGGRQNGEEAGSGILLRVVGGGGVVLCCLWTLTLVLAERRGLLPLDRYFPFGEPEFRRAVTVVWTEPAETAGALLRPLREAAAAGGLFVRAAAAVALAAGIVAVGTGLDRLRRTHLPRMAMAGLGLAAGLVALVTVAGVRTPPERNPVLLEMVRSSSGILWDNYIELAYYEIMRERPLRAERAARKALAIRPGHYSSHWYLGVALRDQGRHAEAAQAFQEVLRLNPGHPMARSARDEAIARSLRPPVF